MPEAIDKIISLNSRLTEMTDVDEVLKDLSRLLKKMLKSSWTAIYLLDREQRDFVPARSCGLPFSYQQMFLEMPLASGNIPLLKDIIHHKHHLQIHDAGESDMLTPRFRRLLHGLTLLALPMVVRNRVTGAVFIARSREYPHFTNEEIDIIKSVVSQAALVVSHIRLMDESLDMAVEMAKRIDIIVTLDGINKAISSSLSHDKIIETAIQSIQRVIQCELVTVFSEERGRLVVTAAHGAGIQIPEGLMAGKPLIGNCLAVSAFKKGESSYLPFLSKTRRLNPFDKTLAEAGIESLLAIPLVSKSKTKGVLLLGNVQGGRFVRDDAFVIEKIASQMAVALDNAGLFEDMRNLFISTVTSLANAIDAKSPWTKGHSERVMSLSADLAKEMGLDEEIIERVRLGGLLHDIGKIGIIEELLEKPTKLSEDEFPPMRLHPEKGVAILTPIYQLRDVLPGILYHHERYDGSGYPKGLKGDAIPLEAKIIGVADSFDAMVSERPYKKGHSTSQALSELRQKSGSQFDPEVVTHFCNYMKKKASQGPISTSSRT